MNPSIRRPVQLVAVPSITFAIGLAILIGASGISLPDLPQMAIVAVALTAALTTALAFLRRLSTASVFAILAFFVLSFGIAHNPSLSLEYFWWLAGLLLGALVVRNPLAVSIVTVLISVWAGVTSKAAAVVGLLVAAGATLAFDYGVGIAIEYFNRAVWDMRKQVAALVTFAATYFATIVMFALIYRILDVANGHSVFDFGTAATQPAPFAAYFYLSALNMTSGGPPNIIPRTTAGYLCVAFQALIGVFLIASFLQYIVQVSFSLSGRRPSTPLSS